MTGDPTSPNFTGVKKVAFDAMAGQHARAAGQLERLAQTLWAELNRVGLDTSPAIRIRNIATQVRQQAADLGRRQRLVDQMERQHMPGMFLTTAGTFWQLPDNIDALQGQVDGAAAAGLVQAAASGNPEALAQLKAYAKEANNPAFAKAFVQKLRAAGMVDAVGRLGFQIENTRLTDPRLHENALKDSKIVLSMLSTSLAQTTNSHSPAYLGPQFLNELKAAGRAQHTLPTGQKYSGYWALGQIMRFADTRTPYGGEYMKVVGRDMIDWDRHVRKDYTWPGSLGPFGDSSEGSSPGGQEYHLAAGIDPLTGLMKAAATSREAAQGLFYDGQGQKAETLKYLISQRWHEWQIGDQGDALGLALEQAAGGNDELSKTLAVQLTQVRADDIASFMKVKDNHWDLPKDQLAKADALAGMRDSFAAILGNHIDDVGVALLDEDPGRPDPGKEVMSGGAHRALFDGKDLAYLLGDIGHDKNAYNSLLWAQAAHMRAAIDHAYDSPTENVQDVANRESRILGQIVEGYSQAQLAAGRSKDAITNEINASTKSVVDFGIGLIPVPGAAKIGEVSNEVLSSAYTGLAKKEYGKFGKMMSQGAAANQLSEAFKTTGAEGKNMEDYIRRALTVSAIEHRVDMDHLREQEIRFEKSHHGEKDLLFTTGTPDTWDKEQWTSFSEYVRDHDAVRIPAGHHETVSLNDHTKNGVDGYNQGFNDLQSHLGLDPRNN